MTSPTSPWSSDRRPALLQVTQKVFLLRGDDLLVLRDRTHHDGDLPGGRLEAGEVHGDWRAAVARELREELGPAARWTLGDAPLFWFPHHVRASGVDALGFAWDATWDGGELQLSDEHEGFAWVPLATFDPATWFVTHQLAAVRRFQAWWRARRS